MTDISARESLYVKPLYTLPWLRRRIALHYIVVLLFDMSYLVLKYVIMPVLFCEFAWFWWCLFTRLPWNPHYQIPRLFIDTVPHGVILALLIASIPILGCVIRSTVLDMIVFLRRVSNHMYITPSS